MDTPNPVRAFVSHSLRDADVAGPITESLRDKGIATWSDLDIPAGVDRKDQIEDALKSSSLYILVFSPDSLDSPWFNFELGAALNRSHKSSEVRLVPILTKGTTWNDVPASLRHLKGIDATRLSREDLLERLGTVLEAISRPAVTRQH